MLPQTSVVVVVEVRTWVLGSGIGVSHVDHLEQRLKP